MGDKALGIAYRLKASQPNPKGSFRRNRHYDQNLCGTSKHPEQQNSLDKEKKKLEEPQFLVPNLLRSYSNYNNMDWQTDRYTEQLNKQLRSQPSPGRSIEFLHQCQDMERSLCSARKPEFHLGKNEVGLQPHTTHKT